MLIKKLSLILAIFATLLMAWPAATTCLWAQEAVDDTFVDEGPEDTGGDVGEGEQIDEAKIKAMKLQEQWEDMLHYINIARPQLAASYAKAILENKEASPKEIYMLSVQNDNTMTTLRKAENLKAMAKLVPQLRARIDQGWQGWRSDPAQIEEALTMMGGTLRGLQIGIQRLKVSGEYAIPMLLFKLTDPNTNSVLRDRIVTMLHELGRPAVRGYSVALQSDNAQLVEFLANALGRMGYPSALPRLREALEQPEFKDPQNNTRKALERAIISCSGGKAALEKPVSELFFQQGQKYYEKDDSLLPDPKDESKTALVWFWKKDLGVEARPVPKQIFCDIYAMRMARLTLKYQPDFYPAVPLWLSACLRRQLELPEGEKDPLWPETAPRAQYYALASSPQYLQMVLARALKDNDVAIASETIQAMSKNTGAVSLVKPLTGGARPLVSAMAYPNLNVRFLAAETLALAMPTTKFTGDEVVMSLLGEALRQKGKKYAMLVVKDQQKRNKIQDFVRSAGFETIEAGKVSDVLIVAQQSPGLDVVIVGADTPAADVVDALRNEAIYNHIPVLVTAQTSLLRDLAERDGKVVLLAEEKTDEKTIAGALEQALAKSAGKPLSVEAAGQWAIRAAKVIRQVGLRSDVIFDLRSVVPQLADALKTGSEELQTEAAGALAVIDLADAQRALVNKALDTNVDEKIRIVAFNAASESARRFGNRCTSSQTDTLVKLVTANGSHELMQAAARLLGALDLPSEQMPELINSTDNID